MTTGGNIMKRTPEVQAAIDAVKGDLKGREYYSFFIPPIEYLFHSRRDRQSIFRDSRGRMKPIKGTRLG